MLNISQPSESASPVQGGEPTFRSLKTEKRAFPVDYVLALVSLVALAGLAQLYDLESVLHVRDILLLSAGFFAVYYWLSDQAQNYFFLLSTWVALFVIAGPAQAMEVIIYGSVCISAAVFIRQPRVKYAVLALLFILPIWLLATDHAWIQDKKVAFATFGAMFMFRMSIFLYDKAHEKIPPHWTTDFGYFFMLPNMALMLFPTVDYRLFVTRKNAIPRNNVVRKGIHWITLGVFHLLMYRIFYFYLLTPLGEVHDFLSFFAHAVSNYLLIVRLSGIFHLSVGILCLFGFDLPAIFNNYFLASGFSDLWRRINIYFREYLLKVFYYPIFFKLRKFGMGKAIVLTIMILFVITWLLHSFQWFWLKGKFPLKIEDAIFWLTFGVLVAGNALLDFHRKGRSKKTHTLVSQAMRTTAQILAMFLFMSFLWTFWSASSLHDWLVPVRDALHSPARQYLIGLLILAGAWVVGTLAFLLIRRMDLGKIVNPDPMSMGARSIQGLIIFGFLAFQIPRVHEGAGQLLGLDPDGLLTAKMTEADERQMIEGYYAEILVGNEVISPLADIQSPRKEHFKFTEAAQSVTDIRDFRQKPNIRISFKGKTYTTNAMGMRDQNYPVAKPAHALRSLFLGGSFVVGSGVADDEVFDAIMEKDMNTGQDSMTYEFINAGCSSYDLIDCMVRFDSEDLARLKPDYLMFFSQGVDKQKNFKDIITTVRTGLTLPFPTLRRIVDSAELKKDMSDMEMYRRLEPYGDALLTEAYSILADQCRDNGITPVWVFWPTIGLRPGMYLEKESLEPLVKSLGYLVIDLEDVYKDVPAETLYVAPNDRHPNALGHRLLAKALEGKLKALFQERSQPIQ